MDDPKDALRKRIENDFIYHQPNSNEVIEAHEFIRKEAKHLAHELVEHCPYSRELSLALTSLEETMMWANAAIARNQRKD